MDATDTLVEVLGSEGLRVRRRPLCATTLRDDMLRLIFTCCHPALGREAQVALSLRTLARLEVPAIARAFLVPEATMAKRLVRARSKIATARIPYAIPSNAELPGRLAAGRKQTGTGSSASTTCSGRSRPTR
jgi:predicted RNA polymerase sigma factor